MYRPSPSVTLEGLPADSAYTVTPEAPLLLPLSVTLPEILAPLDRRASTRYSSAFSPNRSVFPVKGTYPRATTRMSYTPGSVTTTVNAPDGSDSSECSLRSALRA
ncbi:MAG: hypothetical protein BWY09_02628 [Candidatus Hydrogenedentes bacterium ADurb.Bin179]|nr:MAG: hypothetical protein BWY09_02628 [Candidatus Hydrogenedentes bacterium ADurb.Bin179]